MILSQISADKVPDEMAPDRDIASQAARVTRARVAAGFKTMAAAARALGWPYPTYASYENGTISVRSRAEDLANLFGVEVQWLIDGTGPMFKGGKDPILEMFHELSVENAELFRHLLESITGRRRS